MTILQRISTTALAILMAVATGVTAETTTTVQTDELAQTIAACGKPVRDYSSPAEQKTRVLGYHKATLWFGSTKNGGWAFQGWSESADASVTLGRDGVVKRLPCFAKVIPHLELVAPPAAPPVVDTYWASGTNSTGGTTGVLVALWGVGAILYFIPWIVAAQRGVRDQAGIIIVNLLLGWTILGWVGALVWAVSAKTAEHHKETVQQESEASTAGYWVKPGSPAVTDTVVPALPVVGGQSESDSVWM
jgi:hypothetical protein